MSKSYIRYRSGYKYQLATSYSMPITIKPKKEIKTKFIELDTTGKLTIKEGYAWDGPSGPVVDTKENMRASLVHDALYQLMRLKKLSATAHKDSADKIFKNICIQTGFQKKLLQPIISVLNSVVNQPPIRKTKRKSTGPLKFL